MIHDARRAFTLLELTVVVAIMAVLAGIGIARVGSAGAEYRAELAAQRVAGDLREAGRQSLYRAATVTVKFDKATDSYTITGLNADGETTTVSLAESPYRADLTAIDVGGGDTLTYVGGAASNGQPVSLTVDVGAAKYDIDIATAADGTVTGVIDIVKSIL